MAGRVLRIPVARKSNEAEQGIADQPAYRYLVVGENLKVSGDLVVVSAFIVFRRGMGSLRRSL